MPSMPAAHYHQGLPCRDRSCAAANVPLEPGDLPEGQQSNLCEINGQPLCEWCKRQGRCTGQEFEREEAEVDMALPSMGRATGKVKIFTEDGWAAEVARVRADVAEDLWHEAQRLRDEDWPAKVGIEYVEGFESAVAWIERQTPRPPAESVVGAPTPISAPSDLAAPRDGITDQDFADLNAAMASARRADPASTSREAAHREIEERVAPHVAGHAKHVYDVIFGHKSPAGALPEDEGTRHPEARHG